MISIKILIVTWAAVFSVGAFAADKPKAETEKPALEKAGDAVKETTAKASEAVQETASKAGEVMAETRLRRTSASYFGLVNYSPLDLMLPNKIGITAGIVKDVDRTFELEYLRGSLSIPIVIDNLGKMTDQRISLITRSYLGRNSFNISYGVSYFDFSLHLGSEMITRASAGNIPTIDVIKLQSLGANFAIGNRWTFDHGITVGIDWITWAQPLFTTSKHSPFLDKVSNVADRDLVEKEVRMVSYFPRFAVLKLQVGMVF